MIYAEDESGVSLILILCERLSWKLIKESEYNTFRYLEGDLL